MRGLLDDGVALRAAPRLRVCLRLRSGTIKADVQATLTDIREPRIQMNAEVAALETAKLRKTKAQVFGATNIAKAPGIGLASVYRVL